MNTINIAIADDHQELRRSISNMFKKDERFHLNIEARNGTELLNQLTEKEMNVVILDIRMPVLNGIETLELIKEKYPNIKVIMFSSQSDPFTVRVAKSLGANSFVDKFYPEILKDTVIQVYNEEYSYNSIF
jgi:two-component system chemotaxis response regulator CheB